jgi:hypothetical protein
MGTEQLIPCPWDQEIFTPNWGGSGCHSVSSPLPSTSSSGVVAQFWDTSRFRAVTQNSWADAKLPHEDSFDSLRSSCYFESSLKSD